MTIHRLGLLLTMLAFLGVMIAGLVDVTGRDVPMLENLAVYIQHAVVVGIFRSAAIKRSLSVGAKSQK